jgi:EAL domain-containing protein (putative c-di-GMP-specific phosphodiesterase class I)
MQMVFQPIASIVDGSITEYEVLARMVADDGQIILPGGFMPAAERFGLITGVDRWIVGHAILALAELHRHGEFVRFSINLSARALEDKALLELIRVRLEETQLGAHWLTFEITETAAIGNLNSAIEFISALKDIGCQLALDDFGSGFSSFAYLKHLPVDKLKIDGAFVQNMIHNSVDQAMVQSMNQIAHALGKTTIAEFVENEETYALLKHFGVDYAQGYYIGKPMKKIFSASPKTVRRGGGAQYLALQ